MPDAVGSTVESCLLSAYSSKAFGMESRRVRPSFIFISRAMIPPSLRLFFFPHVACTVYKSTLHTVGDYDQRNAAKRNTKRWHSGNVCFHDTARCTRRYESRKKITRGALSRGSVMSYFFHFFFYYACTVSVLRASFTRPFLIQVSWDEESGAGLHQWTSQHRAAKKKRKVS